MPPASNLLNAASQCFNDLYTLWLAGTLKTKLVAFWKSLISTPDVFPEENDGNDPVSNWLTLISVTADQMVVSGTDVGHNVPYVTLNTVVGYVFRLCWMTQTLEDQGTISSTQSNAVLAAYNLQFT